MGKYQALEADLFSIFATAAWKAEAINTYPANFVPASPGSEFVRVSAIPSGPGLNLSSVSGIFVVDIFISAGGGPSRTSFIADKLDTYLVGKSIMTGANGVTQLRDSSLGVGAPDRDNPTLYRTPYTIPFNYFGV